MISKQTGKTKIILAGILISVILFACLAVLGYFGVKTMRRTRSRVEAREAFAAENWKKAEILLNRYIEQDPDSEEDVVRLAQVYRHLGNKGEEMVCWHRAGTLNPLKPEYWDAYIECAMAARDFQHLFTYLSRKAHFDGELSPKEKILYLICAVMTDRARDAEQFYDSVLSSDPEAFKKDELGRYAEFLVKIRTIAPDDRSRFIEQGIRSDDPFVRLESILFYLGGPEFSGQNSESVNEQMETMLKQAAALNRFAGTPYLAKFYFSRLRFSSVIEVLEPYLADIAHIPMSLIYAESCVYGDQTEKLKPLSERFRNLGWKTRLLASYFDALCLFSQGENNNDELARLMRDVGGVVQSNLANLIDLQISLNSDSVDKVGSSLEKILSNPPFYNIHSRARSAVQLYLWNKIQENPELAEDPRMAKLAQLVSEPGKSNPFLMRIAIADLSKRNMLTRQILQDYLNAFPYDPYLLQVAAEFELFNGDPEQSLEYIERFYEIKDETTDSSSFDLLHLLALELSGNIDEAAKEYTALVDNNETNQGILYRYFDFCIRHRRRTELSMMAKRLEASTVPELKALAPFFRAEELFLQEKTEDALALLETAKTDQPDFTLYAANKFSACGRADQALSLYLALVGRHPDQRVVLANIAEIQMARGKKDEAISYAKQCWELNRNDGIGQFVYAQMLAADGRYQDAEKVLRIPNRKIELPDEVGKLWTDIMVHCVREDLANRFFSRALDRTKHYLIFFPDDPTFMDYKMSAELEETSGFEKTEK